MADAQTNAARIGFIKEASYGSTAALAAALKTLRFTEESLTHNKNATWSNEMTNTSGNRAGVIDISKSASGSFTSELSYTDFVEWLVAGIRAPAGTPSGGTTTYKNGLTVPSWYFEKQFTDLSAFHGFYGMTISEMSLALSANEIAKLTLGFMGQKGTKETATRGVGSPTITAPASDAAIRCSADVANLKLDGSAFPCAVKSLNLTFNHNGRAKTEIGKDAPTGQGSGTLDVSGSMQAYFASQALFDAFLAHTAKALSFELGNAAGKFGLTLPTIYVMNHSTPAGGINSDVMADISFSAALNAAAACTVQLDVTPAT